MPISFDFILSLNLMESSSSRESTSGISCVFPHLEALNGILVAIMY